MKKAYCTKTWEPFDLENMRNEEQRLLSSLRAYRKKEDVLIPDEWYVRNLDAGFGVYDDGDPFAGEWHPTLPLAFAAGMRHKGHPIPEGHESPQAILAQLADAVFPEDGKKKQAFLRCASLYLAYASTLRYFEENNEDDVTATWDGFLAWLSFMQGMKLKNPGLTFTEDRNGSGRLGVREMDREAAENLEYLFYDIALFWNDKEYETALAVCAIAILQNAPYVHFYDAVTGGADFIGSKSRLAASATSSAATLCKALEPPAGTPADCGTFFTFLHAMTVFQYARDYLTEHGIRPAWNDPGYKRGYEWRVMHSAKGMLRSEIDKMEKEGTNIAPMLHWYECQEGYGFAVKQT